MNRKCDYCDNKSSVRIGSLKAKYFCADHFIEWNNSLDRIREEKRSSMSRWQRFKALIGSDWKAAKKENYDQQDQAAKELKDKYENMPR